MSRNACSLGRVLVGLLALAGAPATVAAQAFAVAIESDHILDLAFSLDGKFIVGAGFKHKVRVWNAKTGELVHKLGGDAGPSKITRAVAFSPDSKFVAAGGDDGIVRIWELATGKVVLAWIGHGAMISSVAFSPDGKHLAAGSTTMENQGVSYRSHVKLWEFGPGKEGRSFKCGTEHYPAVAFSPDSKMLAVAEGSVKLWNVANGELRREWSAERGKVLHVAFSADGKTLAGGGGDWVPQGGGTVQIAHAWIWDAETGKLRRSFDDLNTWLRAIALAIDGTRLATGCCGKEKSEGARSWIPSELKLWDTASGKELWALHGGPGDVHALAISPDGGTIVYADGEYVRLVNAKDGSVAKVLMSVR